MHLPPGCWMPPVQSVGKSSSEGSKSASNFALHGLMLPPARKLVWKSGNRGKNYHFKRPLWSLLFLYCV